MSAGKVGASRLYDLVLLATPCPICAAGEGERCVWREGFNHAPHRRRIEAAIVLRAKLRRKHRDAEVAS